MDRVIGPWTGSIGWSRSSWLVRVGLVGAGTAFVAAAARIAVPLPFTPVPITAQTLAVLLVGALYGSRLGFATLLAYLAEGLAGLPVFHQGTAGPAVLFGPTGGYLIGFALAAFLVGLLLERNGRPRLPATAAAFLLGDALLNAVGALWLAHFVGAGHAWTDGVLPFIPGEIIKITIATVVLAGGWRLLARDQQRAMRGVM
ncbi:MAG: biotin transporter BioY [Chloroflexota bacterium]